MIIKSLSRKANPTQLIQYVLKYSLKEKQPIKDKEQATLILRHNLRSRSVAGYIKEFKENESFRLYRRNDSVILFHNIISFSPFEKEKVSDVILKDIAAKFVALRGFDCICLGVAHKEKAHTHLHLVVSGVKIDGYSSRVSKQEFASIINQMERYQQKKYPELIHSKNTHGFEKTKTKEQLLTTIKNNRQSIKQSLTQHLETSFAKAKSYQHFLTTVTTNTYVPYYRNDVLQGISVNGQKFRLSRLGFAEKLQALQEKTITEQTTLSQLNTLRKQKEQNLQKIVAPKEVKPLPRITVLHAIRQNANAKSNEREYAERSIGINDREKESVAHTIPSPFDYEETESLSYEYDR